MNVSLVGFNRLNIEYLPHRLQLSGCDGVLREDGGTAPLEALKVSFTTPIIQASQTVDAEGPLAALTF